MTLVYATDLLAEAYAVAGRHRDALRSAAEVLDWRESGGGLCYAAELYRRKGLLLLSLPQADQAETEAEACFRCAIEVARDQEARMWELRAVTSLARLWRDQGRRDEAYALLAPIYGWFTEGFGTPDLRDAKALLDQLAQDR